MCEISAGRILFAHIPPTAKPYGSSWLCFQPLQESEGVALQEARRATAEGLGSRVLVRVHIHMRLYEGKKGYSEKKANTRRPLPLPGYAKG